jgi:glycosyltransferase involved in cell wall biosynthesis
LWLIERLARAHDLHVFALFQDGAPPEYGLLGARVHHIGRKRTGLRALTRLWREHRRQPFDVLHAVWGSPAGVLAALAGRWLRRPVVLHLFGGELVAMPEVDYGELRTAKGRRRMKLALRGATRLTTQSRLQQNLAEAQGYRAQHLPMGVNLRDWVPVPPRPRESGRPARLLHVASLNPVKDQTTLIHAAAVAAPAVAFRLDIAGEDTLRGRIQAEAMRAGLAGQVCFHGFLDQQRLRPLMLQADLLVMSSRSEAGPIVLAEAAACGVPTVGTAVGQIADWAPAAAVAVPPARPDALAAAILELLADDERRLRIATVAQQRAIAEDADWSAARISGVYQEITGR